MNWKKSAVLFFAACAMAMPAAASDLTDVAALPPMFNLRALPGTQSIAFMGEEIPYEAAQLTADMRRDDMFLSGYLFYGMVPEKDTALLDPYFKYNPTTKEFVGMAALNTAFFDEHAPFHEALEASISTWADRMVGGQGAHLDVTLSEMEPVRRTDGMNCILYTAGTQITLNSEGLIMPLYGKGYVYKDGKDYCFVLLITGDDSKQPLTYALDDMVKAAAEAAAKRDLKTFVEHLKASRN